jgi:ribosomal protein L2
MGTRQFKPVTPATRFRSVSDFGDITKSEPERTLVEPLKGSGGRNNKGHITSAIAAAATSGSIARSTSAATSSAFRPR